MYDSPLGSGAIWGPTAAKLLSSLVVVQTAASEADDITRFVRYWRQECWLVQLMLLVLLHSGYFPGRDEVRSSSRTFPVGVWMP